jgi:HlyD family secretion protein
MTHRVERSRFIYDITERGDVESARNVEIVSKVKSAYGGSSGGTTILWIVPEGTYVEPGDKVVELDSAALELERTKQEIVVRNSQASVTQAENSHEAAKIAKQEYLNGTYREDELTLDNQIKEATENRDRLKDYWEFSKDMYESGYVTKLQLDADYSALLQAENKLELARLKREVLEDYKREKMILQLDADIATSAARLEAEKASNDLDQERLQEIERQIANCTIRSESPGQVVYANREGRRGGEGEIIIQEGTLIRERQAIVRLPDPKSMQVTAEINEAKVTLIRKGMSATVRLDAFPDKVLKGVVQEVKEYPVVDTFLGGSSVKNYETIVKIVDASIDLRSGYTAEVKIRVEELPDVLQVPVQAIIEHGGKHYCLFWKDGHFEAREVTIGSTNDKFVVVKEGLKEGEEVVYNAAAYRDEVGLPEGPPKAEEQEEERLPEDYLESGPEAVRGGGDLPSQPRRAAPPSAAGMLQGLDTNGNGQIDRDELDQVPEAMRAGLEASDANGDGVIDRGEMAAAAARISSAARRGGLPPGSGRGAGQRGGSFGGPGPGFGP